MKKPIIRVISNKAFNKRTGLKSGGYTSPTGKTIFHTADTDQFTIEHEKAHVKFGHTQARLTAPQFVKRELKADKEASRVTGEKYKKKWLSDIVKDTSNRFDIPQKQSALLVRKTAKDIGLI